MGNLDRLEKIIALLPETERVDIEQWGGHPSYRVKGKNFVFSNLAGTSLSLKLPVEEARAVVATDETAGPTGYGLGNHGWIDFSLSLSADAARWQVVQEWVVTSYTPVAPRRLAEEVLDRLGDFA